MSKKKLTARAAVRKILCLSLVMIMLISGAHILAINSAAAGDTKASYTAMSSKVDSTVNSAKNRINQLYDLDTELLEGYFTEVFAKLEEFRTATGDKTALESEINELCNKITMASAESKVVSARATWHRPSENSYSAIESTMQTLRDCGMNLVFVESFYHGYTIYKSDDVEFPYYPTLAKSYTDTESGIVYNDYLSAFLACAEKYGIEVHAWVENFYVGINGNTTVLVNHPNWVLYNDDGSVIQRKEGGAYIFIDPANTEVQDALINLYKDMFEKNPGLRGLNLDYIRYPVSDKNQDTGYTVPAMMGFYESLGKEFTESQLSDRTKMANKFKQLFDKNYLIGGQTEADSNYKLWVEYRTGIITDFVERVKNEVKGQGDIILSTAVFASLNESLNSKKADWKSWFNSGWIDIATPMAYYSTASAVQSNVKSMISVGGNKCLYYTGLASSYSGLPAYQNKEFIEASYNAGADGYVIFASQQIIGHPDVQLALGSGVGRKIGVLPHADIREILAATFDDILDKADRLYIPAGGMTAEQRSDLAVGMNGILGKPYATAEEIKAVYAGVNTLKITLKYYASGYSLERMDQQIAELLDILDARYEMQIVAESNRPIPDEPVIPDEPEAPEIPETPVEPDVPTEPDAPDEPDDTETPPESDAPDETDKGESPSDTPSESTEETEPEKKLNLFQRIWRAIIGFFSRLFGRKTIAYLNIIRIY